MYSVNNLSLRPHFNGPDQCFECFGSLKCILYVYKCFFVPSRQPLVSFHYITPLFLALAEHKLEWRFKFEYFCYLSSSCRKYNCLFWYFSPEFHFFSNISYLKRSHCGVKWACWELVWVGHPSEWRTCPLLLFSTLQFHSINKEMNKSALTFCHDKLQWLHINDNNIRCAIYRNWWLLILMAKVKTSVCYEGKKKHKHLNKVM